MVFEYILQKNNLNPKTDLTIVQNIDFGLTAEAFASGQGDYTVEFEPAAEALEREGKGKVVSSLGVESGLVPYTAYSAKKSFIEKNPDAIQSFVNAIQKGMEYVNSHTPQEIADVIAPQFAETKKEALVNIVTRYYEQNTWKEDTIFQEDSFNLLQDILEQSGEIKDRASYTTLVNTEFSKKAVNQ